ncbi:hypothetical protein ACFVVM_24155 [Nocardia sp. NPDC058176]|uniref:hypothetical protein n=1 Tax=Nocardia sp. NPDC058176 TaxID=3346368 RepID=UPI0036DC8F56
MSGTKNLGKRIPWIVLTALIGLCLGSATLFSLSQPINVVAYWLGYGDPIQVEVTKGSTSSSIGRGSPGEGRVVTDDTEVLLYGAQAGETLTAHPRLISFGGKPYIHHSPLRAAEDLLWLIPTALFGVPFALMLFASIAPHRAQPITQRLRAYTEKQRRQTNPPWRPNERP